MSITREELVALLDQRLQAMQTSIEGKIAQEVGSLKQELETVKRTVNAIETFPVPHGRPKTYVAATQYHSVTEPVRVRQGHQG